MEIIKKPLVDVLSSITEKVIAMRGEEYVYLDSKELVDSATVATAVEKQEEMFVEETQNEFRKQRDDLLVSVIDFYQKPLVWENLTTVQQDKVREYRKALLDATITWELPQELVL